MERLQTKTFLFTMVLIGALALSGTAANWQVARPVQFVCFFAIAMAGSMLKVTLPGVTGTMSVNYVFVLIGVAELSLAECLLMACASVIMQCLYRATRRPTFIQVAFNVSNVAIAVVACNAIYHSTYLRGQGLGAPMLATAASIGYFLTNTFPVASIIALTEKKSLRRVWKECYLWSFPFYLVGAAIASMFHLISGQFGWQIATLTLPAAYIVYNTYRLYLGRLQDEKLHAEAIAALHLRTIEALALAIDAKDHTTHEHLRRVQTYATAIAKELKLPEEEIEAVQAAAVLHDIGKLAVPEHIISKPGRLTPEEFEKMKIHPAVGAEILERVQFPYPVVPIVRSHHEKWDGTGYPDGLRGEAIPIGARILSAVDCLDALASDRHYRKAIPLAEAMAVVASEAGKSYDPEIVRILQKRYSELEEKSRQMPAMSSPLSSDATVERGDSPATGFEQTKDSAAEQDKVGFLTSIAAAREEVQTLFELSNDIGTSLSLSEMLAMVELKLKRMIPYESIAICTVREGALTPEYVSGTDAALFSSLRIPLGQGLSGWVAQNGHPTINGNPAVEPGYLNDATRITNLRSALSIPLENADGIIGVLTLYHSEKNAFSKDHLRILLALSPRLTSAMSNARILTQAQKSATTDFLTGLPNSRSLFLHLDAELARSRRQNSRLTVLVCDLDGFKQVNDQFGHLEGNRILQAVAAALRSCCRDYDYVARMGGDEFVIVLPNIPDDDLAEKIEQLRTAVRGVGKRTNRTMLAVSIGAASFPELVADADGILAEADRKMYGDKRREKAGRAGQLADIPHPLAIDSGDAVRPTVS